MTIGERDYIRYISEISSEWKILAWRGLFGTPLVWRSECADYEKIRQRILWPEWPVRFTGVTGSLIRNGKVIRVFYVRLNLAALQ